MPSDYTPKGAATRLVGFGELNFTDESSSPTEWGWQLDNTQDILTVKWSTTAALGTDLLASAKCLVNVQA